MSEQSMPLGERIKGLRFKRGLSVDQLAEQAGLSAVALGKIENQQLAPPLGEIVSLAKALQVTVGELFGDSADSPFCIVRSDNRKSVSRFGSEQTTGGYSYESLGYQKQNRRMEPFLVTLTPARGQKLEPNHHPGEEILFVLEGEVQVQLAEHTDVLKPGDSIYFDAGLPHVVSCHGNEPARIFAVIYTEQEMIVF